MAKRTCSIDGCDAPHDSHGMCGKHAQRVRRYGDPHATKHIRGDDLARFAQYVDVGDCWEWTGTREEGGYGRFSERGVLIGAHRWVWEELVGPIPEDMTIDHMCRNPPCVNPDHLRLMPLADNVLIGYGPPAQNARKTHCKRGHEFTPENTRIRSGGRRECRTCMRVQLREQKRRKRERGSAR